MITLRMEVNRRRQHLLVDVCETGLERTRGLLFRRRLASGEALLIPRCRAVHTAGLWYPIDVAFCAGDGTVLGLIGELRPWRVAGRRDAEEVWELPAGAAKALALRVGDRLLAR